MTGIIPYSSHVETLANGMKVILMPMPGNGLVAYWTIVRTGSGQEYEPGRSGFAHFFEHMMFRGTEKYPADVYQQVLTRIGADANAYTTDDLTAFHLSFAAEDLEQVMELESDRFERLAYPERSFETEAGAVYGEYRKSRTSPLFTLYEAMVGAAFRTHPYGHTTMGYEPDIAAMPSMYEYSLEFFARNYRPENTVLFVAGDIDVTSVTALAARHYGDWRPGYTPPPIPAEPAQREPRRVEVSYDGRTLPLIWVAYKIDAFEPDNRLRTAADLLAELAFGPTSEIYQRLVLDEQSVEFLEAEPNKNRDPGLLDIYARIKQPSKVEEVLSAIEDTAAVYRRSPADEQRLAALKSRLKYSFLMNLETPDEVASQLARPIAISGGLHGIEALYRQYEGITAEDVRQAAQAYLVPDRRTVAVLKASE
jgi:zinc protease